MSALSKIRNNMGLVITLIVISLAAFVLTDFFTGKTSGPRAGADVAGEVGGVEVSYNVIQNRVQDYSRNRADGNIEDTYKLRGEVWNEIVGEIVNEKEYNSLGINVSSQEESMLYFGPIYHPYLFQFPYFRDSTQQFNPEVVRLRLEQADQINEFDPNTDEGSKNFKLDMISLKKAIKSNRLAFKWESMIRAGIFVSDNELQIAHESQQKKVNISYVSVPYASVTEEQAQPTEEDFQKFYDSHKESFRRVTEQVNIKYTYFPVNPSSKDSTFSREEISRLKEDFVRNDDPFRFAFSNSDTRLYDTLAKPISELPLALQANAQKDTVIGPVLSPEGYKLDRIVDIVEDASYIVNARHVLVTYKGVTAQDTTDARTAAFEIRNQLNANPASFAQVVTEKSDDFQTKATGGELGWINPDSIRGGNFAQKIGSASTGSFTVASSAKGYHVVQVNDRTNKRYSFAELTQSIIVSTETSDSVYKRASQYAGQVLANADMDETLKDFLEAGTNVSGPQVPSSYKLIGLEASRVVINWAFKAEEGQVSEDILDANNALVIAKVLEKNESGYASLDAVRSSIAPLVARDVKARFIKNKLSSLSGNMASIATSYGSGATSGVAPGLVFASNSVPGLGNEPKVVGRAFGMNQGESSQPIVGSNGVYMIQVDAVTEAPELVDVFRDFQRQQLQQGKSTNAINSSSNGLRDIAKVKDYRYRFNL